MGLLRLWMMGAPSRSHYAFNTLTPSRPMSVSLTGDWVNAVQIGREAENISYGRRPFSGGSCASTILRRRATPAGSRPVPPVTTGQHGFAIDGEMDRRPGGPGKQLTSLPMKTASGVGRSVPTPSGTRAEARRRLPQPSAAAGAEAAHDSCSAPISWHGDRDTCRDTVRTSIIASPRSDSRRATP